MGKHVYARCGIEKQMITLRTDSKYEIINGKNSDKLTQGSSDESSSSFWTGHIKWGEEGTGL